MLTLEQKYTNMVKRYRDCQKANKKLIKLLEAYDGAHALDQWDVDVMPSKEWAASLRNILRKEQS